MTQDNEYRRSQIFRDLDRLDKKIEKLLEERDEWIVEKTDIENRLDIIEDGATRRGIIIERIFIGVMIAVIVSVGGIVSAAVWFYIRSNIH